MADPSILLDTSRVFDENMVALLDTVIDAMFDSGSGHNREAAHKILEQFRTLPDSWKHVAVILSCSKNTNTKFFALQVLQMCIQTRWNVLAIEDRLGIRSYVADLVIKLSMDDEACNRERHFLTKLNETLIQIVKREWPERWDNFIPEICRASQVSQSLCENNMRLLNMLSEELFDFGEDHMQSRTVQRLTSRMSADFKDIFELCIFVMHNSITNPESVRVSLVKQTLTCLAHFLKWIPVGYIFEQYFYGGVNVVLIDLLLDHFWDSMTYRVECTKCLTEIAGLSLSSQEMQAFGMRVASMWPKLVAKVSSLPENSTHYDDTNHVAPCNRLFWETFYCQFSICCTNFLKNFRESIVERDANNHQSLIYVLERLVAMTDINHEETFKICLDYWHIFVAAIMRDVKEHQRQQAAERGIIVSELGEVQGFNPRTINLNQTYDNGRLGIYRPVLVQLQRVLIKRMAKPQEVYILYDADACEVTREYNPNTAEIALYNRMKTVLINLTTIMQEDTERIMMEVLDREMEIAHSSNRRDTWDPTILNRLCYSVGSISGAMDEMVEKRFLVLIIKCLLNICEVKTATGDKAIVASNIMYVVGQYPRFLKNNWRFLYTVMNKLFEFMREMFPGVQQMACETFLKITTSCKKTIAMQTLNDVPYINELIRLRDPMTGVLDDKLILWFYESVGNVISAVDNQYRHQTISMLMERCNCDWQAILGNTSDPNLLSGDAAVWATVQNMPIYHVETTRSIIQILRMNNRVAKSTGSAYTRQLMYIYPGITHLYNLYSCYIQNAVKAAGPGVLKHNNINLMHLVRRSILHLLETYIGHLPNKIAKTYSEPSVPIQVDNTVDMDQTEDCNMNNYNEVLNMLIQSITSTVLVVYRNCLAETRDHEVICVVTTLIEKLGNSGSHVLPQIFEQIFDCTLDMVKMDFHSFPEHREYFYEMLQKCTKHCFDGLLLLPSERLRAYVMSLIWAFKHEHPSVAERGLTVVREFLNNLMLLDRRNDQSPGGQGMSAVLSFCRNYYYLLLKEILGVLTDTLHKSGFRLQTEILRVLIRFLECGTVNDPSSELTRVHVMKFLVELLGNSFITLNVKQVEAFVVDLFNFAGETIAEQNESMMSSGLSITSGQPMRFQTHVKDFLLSLKEFAGSGDEFDRIFEQDRQNAIERARAIEQRKLQHEQGIYNDTKEVTLD
ncbi:CRM1 exportin C terminal family protein [Babesia bovis T2Bo]|uniref:Exportin 1, putative n=1 Tax=Babesia bovis TaxID=5865 RepID=A7AUR1_BABBO|nr:CRM1 exportin C terminal family protein [Babesia bovis T2Bo]EDO06672.1 CRM1 exportin C terminal family protein [Babesia bovis T2Bo]|eukprot:XP_001610240.1 exportin 1 [Babesia bovis T2Bo]